MPRLAGRTMPAISEKPCSGPSIQGSYSGTLKWIGWRSGATRPGPLRAHRWLWACGTPGAGVPISRSVGEDQRRQQVVVQVAADPWQVERHLDAQRAQVLGRADAGQHQ